MLSVVPRPSSKEERRVCKCSMSKAKWFAVRKPSTGEIIAKSANQIVPPKFRGGAKVLYCIHQIPLSSWRIEGESGDETIPYSTLW